MSIQLDELTIEQLEDLAEEQDSDEEKEMLRELIERRRTLLSSLADERAKQEQKGTKTSRRSSIASRTPRERHIRAVKTFNADPERVKRLNEILKELPTDEDGNYLLSEAFMQLGIGAYYLQRRLDELEKQDKKSQNAKSPSPAQSLNNKADLDNVDVADLEDEEED